MVLDRRYACTGIDVCIFFDGYLPENMCGSMREQRDRRQGASRELLFLHGLFHVVGAEHLFGGSGDGAAWNEALGEYHGVVGEAGG